LFAKTLHTFITFVMFHSFVSFKAVFGQSPQEDNQIADFQNRLELPVLEIRSSVLLLSGGDCPYSIFPVCGVCAVSGIRAV
jgi:hypothetical protein